MVSFWRTIFSFASRINRLISLGLGVDADEATEAAEAEEPVEEIVDRKKMEWESWLNNVMIN